VVTQIANHLAVSGGKFSGTEAIFVMAGGNDVLYQLGALQAARRLPARRPVRPPVPMPARKPLPRTGRGPGGRRPESCHGGASHRRGRGRRQRGAGATSATSSVPPCRRAVVAGNTAVASPAVYGPLVAKAQADATVTGNAAGAAAGAKAGADYAAAQARC
jgi:hypothetical protein